MDKVVVLLSSYNGEKYIREQLDSILAQEEIIPMIIVRDDGSTDKTCSILDEYQQQGNLTWYNGENLKPARSFIHLIQNAPECQYYALCDQDDFWMKDKLKIAISKLRECNAEKPALYYGCPRLVDAELNLLPIYKGALQRMTDFNSMLINSNATGCTMVFNKKLLDIVKQSNPDFIYMHDAWIHKICIINNGTLLFDEDVHILYRQHGNNVVGISNSKIKKVKQHLASLKSKECIRSKTLQSLEKCYGYLLTPERLQELRLTAYYKMSFKSRVKLLLNSRIKTAYARRNILFELAVLLGTF